MLLDDDERARVKGVIINKFRGNVDYFKDAMKQLEEIVKVPVLGVLPYYKLDIEDEEITEAQGEILKNNINYIVDSMMAFFDSHPDCELKEEWKKFDSIITELLGINYGN